ncbi:glutamate-1-semialdehyde 2,1-aminomutase [Lentisphaera profundi]|uniref:Glutamate-1-semialdehyde 2,1-aminomutase n=1 Tax=Lentisphaera profundi TaxID=1658616 RepID=A0ABY7VXJ5_9BACT|nr:glutamate-1-semialdehyde 2,1-aminomutase [Lentisphaera profundi]WDE97930.1 glutamate-1-semialdehyde 2,1-aminomutase [Lentisphaera profundi]
MSLSNDFYTKAKDLIPGGVDSPVRAFGAVGGDPLFFEKAKGAYLTSVDGDEYLDFVLSWGPAVLGHAHPEVVEAVKKQADAAFSFGMSCPLEYELAKLMSETIKGLEMVRFVSSGTEATMSAIRLARGATGKDQFIKFEGCYHGHSDGLLVKAGSGVSTFGTASSAGVPEGYTATTRTAIYNDLESVETILRDGQTAAIILEPVAGNMGLIPGDKDFILGLRRLCDQYEALLIFDEVMCAFRVHEKTAADLYGVTPDLFCFGKVIGGGLPVGAFGGRKDIMLNLAPLGPVYQAGTLSGNPLAMAAGIKNLEVFLRDKVWEKTNQLGQYLNDRVQKIIEGRSDVCFNQLGSMFTLFFKGSLPKNMDEVGECDFDRFGRFFQFALKNHILLPPSQYEANFLSSAHTEKDLDHYLSTLEQFLKEDQ